MQEETRRMARSSRLPLWRFVQRSSIARTGDEDGVPDSDARLNALL
jgi:hypothetical protein